ncbi:MAG TPA: DUF4190 domain-containing protein [Acidimicrobiia bacterium]|nr:DUF4190 domain-containing protein [Acidimicrobiia bacterium]
MSFPQASAYPEESQATTILVLGILSFVCSCFPLGIAAWVLGNRELQAIDAGMRNPANRGTANAGRIIGIVATVLGLIGFVIVIFVLFFGLSLGVMDGFLR